MIAIHISSISFKDDSSIFFPLFFSSFSITLNLEINLLFDFLRASSADTPKNLARLIKENIASPISSNLLVYIKSNPTHDKLVMDKILLISDDPENNLLIEKKLVSNLEEGHFRIHKLLAGFYFKTEKYKDAYEVHL